MPQIEITYSSTAKGRLTLDDLNQGEVYQPEDEQGEDLPTYIKTDENDGRRIMVVQLEDGMLYRRDPEDKVVRLAAKMTVHPVID